MKLKFVKDYKPSKEDIKRICDEAYEENKEWLKELFKKIGD